MARWSYPAVLALVAAHGTWTYRLPGRPLNATAEVMAVAVGLLAAWTALRFDAPAARLRWRPP